MPLPLLNSLCMWLVTESCPILCDPMDCGLPGSSVGLSRQEYWSGLPFPSPRDLPNLGFKAWSPALQVDSLSSEPPGKPQWHAERHSSVQFNHSVVSDSATPWTAARQASLSITNSQSLLHWVGDAVQPSHALSSPCPPAFNPSQHQSLFQWLSSLHQVAKVLGVSPSASFCPMNIQDWEAQCLSPILQALVLFVRAMVGKIFRKLVNAFLSLGCFSMHNCVTLRSASVCALLHIPARGSDFISQEERSIRDEMQNKTPVLPSGADSFMGEWSQEPNDDRSGRGGLHWRSTEGALGTTANAAQREGESLWELPEGNGNWARIWRMHSRKLGKQSRGML